MENVWGKKAVLFLSTREDSRHTPPSSSPHLPETFTFFLSSPSQAFSGFSLLFTLFFQSQASISILMHQCLQLFCRRVEMLNICGRVPPQRTDMGRMGRITPGTRTSRKTPTCFPASRTGPNLNLCTDLMSTPTISNSTSPSA